MQNTISIKALVDRVLRNPLFSDLNIEAVIDYSVDGIKLLGAPERYEDKIKVLEITDYRTPLPCDLIELRQIRKILGDYTISDFTGSCEYGSQIGVDEYNGICEKQKSFAHIQYGMMRYSTDNFHNSHTVNKGLSDLTYTLNNGVIYTNFEKGCVELAFKGIPMDEEGYPLIPDHVSVMLYLENYIKWKHYSILWELGKVTDKVYAKVESEYLFYVGQANAALRDTSINKMESIANGLKTMLPSNLEHIRGFKTFGQKEYIYRK